MREHPHRLDPPGPRTRGWQTSRVNLGQIDWGSVPDWIAGVGSLAAIVVALWISLSEAKLRRRRDEDEEKRPARLVVLGEPALGSPQLGATEASEYVRVHNFGEAPIHQLHVGLAVWRAHDREPVPALIEVTFLGPGESQEFEFAVPDGEGSIRAGELAAYFVDAFGRAWKLNDGNPEPERLFSSIHEATSPELRRLIAASRRERKAPARARTRSRGGR